MLQAKCWLLLKALSMGQPGAAARATCMHPHAIYLKSLKSSSKDARRRDSSLQSRHEALQASLFRHVDHAQVLHSKVQRTPFALAAPRKRHQLLWGERKR